MAKVSEQKAQFAPDAEMLEVELRELQSRVNELSDQLRLISDDHAIMAQQIHEAKSPAAITLPKELVNKIDPAQVFLHALQGAVTAMIDKHQNPKNLRDHIDSQASYTMDIAVGVLKAYIARGGV